MNGLVATFAVLLAAFVAFVTVPFFVAVERPAQSGEAQVVPDPAVLDGVAATADLVEVDAGTAPATADRGLVGRMGGAAVDGSRSGGSMLRERGWVEVAAEGAKRYVGWYQVDGVMRPGVVEHPFRPLTERYEAVGNAYRGNRAKQELVDAGLVKEAEIATGGVRRKLLELTEQGRDHLETEDVEVKRRGRGGIVHRFWQHQVQERFEERGWAVKLELFDADVYANTGDREVVAEVAMGNNEREVEHVEQHLAEGFDEIWVVCRNEDVRDGLHERLAERDLLEERVAFRTFSEISEMVES